MKTCDHTSAKVPAAVEAAEARDWSDGTVAGRDELADLSYSATCDTAVAAARSGSDSDSTNAHEQAAAPPSDMQASGLVEVVELRTLYETV